MQVSGQTSAQAEQPLQASGWIIYAKLYPLAFASEDKAITSVGQATTHKSQPLHFSMSTTIEPTNFAIVLYIKIHFFVKIDKTSHKENI